MINVVDSTKSGLMKLLVTIICRMAFNVSDGMFVQVSDRNAGST